MATKYLGATFDIHGGGLDLRVPASRERASRSPARPVIGFARYWLHNGLVKIGGEKMSKSLGNSLLVARRGDRGAARRAALLPRPGALPVGHRVLAEALAEAAAAYRRIEGFVIRAPEAAGRRGGGGRAAGRRTRRRPTGGSAGLPLASSLPAAFVAALDDDLAVPQALAVVHEV